jgi:hypothetical protein
VYFLNSFHVFAACFPHILGIFCNKFNLHNKFNKMF